jgi:hypothetical protein
MLHLSPIQVIIYDLIINRDSMNEIGLDTCLSYYGNSME